MLGILVLAVPLLCVLGFKAARGDTGEWNAVWGFVVVLGAAIQVFGVPFLLGWVGIVGAIMILAGLLITSAAVAGVITSGPPWREEAGKTIAIMILLGVQVAFLGSLESRSLGPAGIVYSIISPTYMVVPVALALFWVTIHPLLRMNLGRVVFLLVVLLIQYLFEVRAVSR